jgi:hypothetical protein
MVPRGEKEMNYASESETDALIKPDTRTLAEKTVDDMLIVRGADEQGADAFSILRQIAIELIEARMK